jgi:phosphoadenosine phosphosulfate reductase
MTARHTWRPPAPSSRPPAGFGRRVDELHDLLPAIARAHPRAALASSLSVEDMVITHAISVTGTGFDVIVLDTGRLHAETLALLDATRRCFDVPLLVYAPLPSQVQAYVTTHGPDGFFRSTDLRVACCAMRKVEPLGRALAGRSAWITGQRRAHGESRTHLEVEETDDGRGLAKFNPLTAWSDDEVWHYARRFELPLNPLYERGYASIGCEPCTRAIGRDEPLRAGRWWWEQGFARECGLHPPSAPATGDRQ